jgi:predicted ATPase
VESCEEAGPGPGFGQVAGVQVGSCNVQINNYYGSPARLSTPLTAGQGEASRLEEARLRVVEELADRHLALGRHQEVVADLAALAGAHPARERLAVLLMTALWRSGHRGEALAVHERARHALSRELGLDPGPELAALHARLLADDPSLAGPARVAAPARPDAPRARIPAPVGSFVGRREELAELAELIRRYRLVTLAGPGGVGKTRLAIEAAAPLAGEFRDGAAFASLAEVADPAAVPVAVAEALGVELAAGGAPGRQVLDRLSRMHVLLVVDNCEHVIDAAADLVLNALEGAREVRVIATSRQPLGVPGEVVWEAPPFAFPASPEAPALESFDAVRLFTERMPYAPGGLTEADLRAIAVITASLDGLPLAIELAAARAVPGHLPDLAADLRSHIGSTLPRSRASHPRQRTLGATVGWSYELLSPGLRAALSRLSVFAGGFTRAAAAAVIGEPDAAATLAELAERSMIAAGRGAGGQPPRYAMLETIRQYCIARMTREDGPGAAAAIRDAHAAYFAGLARQAAAPLTGRDQARWLAALEAEHANLVAALNRLLGQPGHVATALAMIVHLDRFWSNWGHLGECAAFLQRGLESAGPDVTLPVRAAALRMAGLVALFHDMQEAHGYLAKALEIARAADDRPVMARALWGIADCQFSSGDAGQALATDADAVAIARSTGDAVLLGECLCSHAAHLRDDPRAQSAAYAEVLTLTARSGDRRIRAIAHHNLGDTATVTGDWQAARSHLEQTRAIYAELRGKGEEAISALGWVHLGQGDPGGAEAIFTHALRQAERDYARADTMIAMLGLACTAAALGNWQRAARLFAMADQENAAAQDPWVPPEKTFRDHWITATEREIGPAFKELYAAASDSPRDDAIAFALSPP